MAGGRYIGPRNRKMRVIFEDTIGDNFTPDSNDLALCLERSVGWREKDWFVKTLAQKVRSYGCSVFRGECASLFDEMIAEGHASESSRVVEYHVSQPGEASEDRGYKKLSFVPAGRKQIWCEYPTSYGFPIGGLFLNIELAYAPGEDLLPWLDFIGEIRRTLRVLGEDVPIFQKQIATYLRATQREAVDMDDMGAHVCIQELDEEFAQEWGYPLEERFHGYPVRYMQ